MAADSWHQYPNSIHKKLCTVGKESNQTFEKKTNEQYYQYLQNDIENVSIHILNDDCLRHIFLFLPIIDKVRIERVCKRWKEISQDSWHIMKSLDFSSSTWGFSKSFSIHQICTTILHKLLLKCGKFLTQINLFATRSLREGTLTVVGNLCPNLTDINVITLIFCKSDISTLASNCKNITRLSLGPFRCNCDNELKNLFKANKNLKYLAMNQNFEMGESLLYLPAQTMHTIILYRCKIQENHFCAALKNLKNLKHLRINDCAFRITASILKAISEHCESLNKLVLKTCFSFMESAEVIHLTKLVNLKILKFEYTNLISDNFLINMVQQCQQLTCLDITDCINVTDIGLAAIATLPKLEKLIINRVNKITDYGLKNLYNLKELKCRKCVRIRDHGMSMFIRSSSYLQLLDISGCHNITNVTLYAAKDACDTRSNNLMLKMIIRGTAIFLTKKDKEQVPPLLQIVYGFKLQFY